MMRNPGSRVVAAAFVLAVLVAAPAHAYLDPGTGSMLLQGIIGAFLAVGVTLRLYWHRIKGLFRSGRGRGAAGDTGAPAPGSTDDKLGS